MNATRLTTTARLLGFLGTSVLTVAFVMASAAPTSAQSGSTGFDVFSGRVTFQRYCSSCHGPEGGGDGNIAQYLKIPPTDLTQLSRQNGGEFPVDDARQYIDGRKDVRGHGTREMPVWGEVFQSTLAEEQPTIEEGEERAGRIIDQLVAYLKSIQVD